MMLFFILYHIYTLKYINSMIVVMKLYALIVIVLTPRYKVLYMILNFGHK